MASPSKAKGNRFESEVAKALTIWSGKTFQRTPSSGALRWSGTFWTFGDLTPPEDFKFVIECKSYEDASDFLVRLLLPNCETESDASTSFCSWWYRQAVADAERASAQLGRTFGALLFWKQTHQKARICIDAEVYGKLPADIRAKLACFWVCLPNRRPFMVIDMAAFLQHVSYDALGLLL